MSKVTTHPASKSAGASKSGRAGIVVRARASTPAATKASSRSAAGVRGKVATALVVTNRRPPAPWDEVAAALVNQMKLKITAAMGYTLVTSGMPARLVDPVSRRLGMTKGDLANFMGLDRSTASRLSAADKPLPLHSTDSVLRLIELQELAEEVFGDQEAAKTWLHKPHPLFGEMQPVEIAKSSYGAQRVKQVLVAIKYGGVV